MIRTILPVVFIIAAIALFFGYINPAYEKVKELQADEEQFDQALDKSKELQAVRDKLLSKYNTFSTEDIDRLVKLLPDNIDNVRLVIDIDNIASTYGMQLKNVVLVGEEPEEGVIGPNDRPFGSRVLSFSVISSYDRLVQFLEDLERSLRVVDVIALSFNTSQGDFFDYRVSLRTYWLR